MDSDVNPTDQHVDQVWDTPSHSEIIELTKAHVEAMEMTNDDLVWVQAGMHHVLLTTIGRKTGNEHKVALPTWKNKDGDRIVVASFAGAIAHPSWFVNLKDKQANPKVKVQVQDGKYWSDAQILGSDERNETWRQLCADRAWYATYQGKTDRVIPLVKLPVTEQIES